MLTELYLRCVAVLVLTALVFTTCVSGNPFLEDEVGADVNEEYDNGMDRFLEQGQEAKRSDGSTVYMPMRRACIRRGGNCDNRQTDCCYNSTCRCNLWGSNCKCQRIGIFRKWGKK